MNHGSLFSGIGGFDLVAEWMGWENKFHCEINPFGKKILSYYWPDADSLDDITKVDFKKYNGSIDIISGGFPCQPFSAAGKRKGTEDNRHLWPEMLRAIREVQPRWIVGENVCGLVNWSEGLVFEQVQTDLESEGYEVQPFILPACAKNAPHRRDRIWFIAHRVSKEQREQAIKGIWPKSRNGIGSTTNTNTSSIRQFGKKHREKKPGRITKTGISNNWQNFPTQSPICSRNDGIPTGLDGITFPKWRNESIKGYGNAVVPQVVYEIFQTIEEYETQL